MEVLPVLVVAFDWNDGRATMERDCEKNENDFQFSSRWSVERMGYESRKKEKQ